VVWLLQVKPLVAINHQTGLVEPVSLARSHKPQMKMVYNKFLERLTGGKVLHIAVLYAVSLAKAEFLAGRIREEFNPVELLLTTM